MPPASALTCAAKPVRAKRNVPDRAAVDDTRNNRTPAAFAAFRNTISASAMASVTAPYSRTSTDAGG